MSLHALRLLLLLSLFTVAATWTLPALAQEAKAGSEADQLAQHHFEAGVSYLQEADYEKALQEFQRSFELSNRPEVLLNVATVHERMGNLKLAVEALQRYLALAPEGEHAQTVKIRIQNLEKRIPPEAKEETKPAPAESAPQASAKEGAPEQPAPQQPAQQAPPAQAQGPDHTLAYVVLAAAGAFAVGATITGVMANNEHSDLEHECKPYCSKSQTHRGRTLALVSTLLTGAAVVGAAGGVLLWMSEDGKSGETPVASARPRVDLDVGTDQVRASATWSF